MLFRSRAGEAPSLLFVTLSDVAGEGGNESAAQSSAGQHQEDEVRQPEGHPIGAQLRAGAERVGDDDRAQHTQKAWKERYLVLQKHYGWLPNLFAHGWILFRRLLFNLKLLGK